jgi:glycosyltransferase involved in cell wall biosynthesis
MQTLRHVAVNGWFAGQLSNGSGQYLHHVLNELAKSAQKVRFSLLLPQPRHQSPAPATTDLTDAGVHLLPASLPPLPENLAKLYWEQVVVPQMARRLQADVLWVPYWAAPYWQPTPTVVTVHDMIPRLFPIYQGGWLQRAYIALVTQTARRAAAILTVSEASKRDIALHLGVSAERIFAVHHGPNAVVAPSDLPRARLSSLDNAASEQIRKRYHLPERYFLYLGGFDARKNVRSVLEGYQRYLNLGGDPDIKLVIAGQLSTRDSEFTPDPRRLARDLNLQAQVHCCGWVSETDKLTLYALATAYVFPSFYEGFGMTVLEAMAAGTAVVTSAG